MSKLSKTIQSVNIGTGNFFTWWARRASGGPNVLEINLCDRVVDDLSFSGIWQRIIPTSLLCFRDLLSGIVFAAEDDNIKVILIRISNHDLGWGRVEELCHTIRRFRAAGKYVLAYLEEPQNIDTMIAASCDRVIVPPGVPIYLTGLLSEVMYFKGILDKLDVKPELFQAGKYKSAVEPYTRSGMSQEHREAVESMLDSIYGQWVANLARGRGLSRQRIEELIDQGPWIAEDAREQGLVDELLYEDEVDDYIEKWLGMMPNRISLERFLKVFGPRASMSDPWKKSTALAIITANGTIHGGESRHYAGGDTTIGADTMRSALQQVREDDRIGAVIMRVDSPGGSAVHSDLIWREVDRMTRTKPVVVSMGNVAASGGYYIAMPANHIIASPMTLTGSIGVIGGKINLKGLYEKIGIKKEQVSRGKHADLGTDYGPYSPDLKKKMKKEMDTVYKLFVGKAAKARKNVEDMEEAAQGRVWTGTQAKDIGLVDEHGSLITAIERAKEMAGIPISRRVPVLSLPRTKKFSLPALPLPFSSSVNRTMTSLMTLETLADSPILALMPFNLKIR